jgi:hypothetical protein
MNDDYKNFMEMEIIKGLIFCEEDYSIDTGSHFALAPKDVVEVDLRQYIQDTENDLRKVYSAKYGQVEMDEVTGEIKINGESLAPTAAPAAATTSVAGAKVNKPSISSKGGPIVDFLKTLRDTKSLSKLKDLDPKIRKAIAIEVSKLIDKTHTKKSSKKVVKEGKEFIEECVEEFTDDEIDELNDEIVLCEEIVNILDELKNPKTKAALLKKKSAAPKKKLKSAKAALTKVAAPTKTTTPSAPPKAAAPATPATPAAPATATRLDPTDVKVIDVIKNPSKYKLDSKFERVKNYVYKLRKDYENFKVIPGAKDRGLIALVSKTNDADNTVDVKVMNKTSTGPDGKSKYKVSDNDYTIPFNAVMKRLPAEKAKSRGILSRIFGL